MNAADGSIWKAKMGRKRRAARGFLQFPPGPEMPDTPGIPPVLKRKLTSGSLW